MEDVPLVMVNNKVDPPTESAEFRLYLEGYYGFLVTFFGTQSQMVQAYRDQIVHRLNSLQVGIGTTYMDRTVREMVYLKVLVRSTSIMAAQAPTYRVPVWREGQWSATGNWSSRESETSGDLFGRQLVIGAKGCY